MPVARQVLEGAKAVEAIDRDPRHCAQIGESEIDRDATQFLRVRLQDSRDKRRIATDSTAVPHSDARTFDASAPVAAWRFAYAASSLVQSFE